MQRLYIVPVEVVVNEFGTYRGPKYFDHRYDPDPPPVTMTLWAQMDYGFVDYTTILAQDITQAEHDELILYTDVYAYPPLDQLDQQIAPQDNLDTFFETIHIPTDWLTPANTYLEFLRQMAGMFHFAQRYGFVSQGHSLFENGVTLDTRYNAIPQQQRDWFDQTAESLGYPPVAGNPRLRFLVKRVGDVWATRSFLLGGIRF